MTAVTVSVLIFFAGVAVFVAYIRQNKTNTNGQSVRTKDEPGQDAK